MISRNLEGEELRVLHDALALALDRRADHPYYSSVRAWSEAELRIARELFAEITQARIAALLARDREDR